MNVICECDECGRNWDARVVDGVVTPDVCPACGSAEFDYMRTGE